MTSKRVFKRLLVLVAALGLSSVAASAVEDANPTYASWAKFKAGTSVKAVTETEVMGQKSKTEVTTTLVDVAKDKVTVEVKMAIEVAGQKMEQPGNKLEIAAAGGGGVAATPSAGSAGVPGADVKQGDEDVTIAGKTYKCHVVDATAKYGANATHSRTYTSADVPGYVVKMDVSTDGQMKSHTVTQVVEINIK